MKNEDGIPIIPPLPKEHDPCKAPDANPVVAICGECGIKIHQIMHYSCPNVRCPSGLGGVRLCSVL